MHHALIFHAATLLRQHARHAAYFHATVIHMVRASRGLTQRQLAAASGVSRRTIQNIERGAAVPRKLTLFRIARALEVEPDELLDEYERS